MPKHSMYATGVRVNSSFWAFTLPGFIIFFMVVMIPFGIGFGYSLTSWDGISTHAEFVGLQNYLRVLTDDPRALGSLWFTFRFTAVVVLVSNLLGFVLALGLTRNPLHRGGSSARGAHTLRVIFFLPNVIGGLILGFVWRFILVQGIPSIGDALQLSWLQTPWLGDPLTGFWGTVIVYVWKTAGYLMVIYIAALLNVDRSMIEAADIDGASALKVLIHIKIPMVMPAFTVCFFLMISWAFKLFDVIFSLTGGGPYGSTETFALNIYNEAFIYNNYGMGSAKAVLFFFMVAILSLLQVRATKKREVHL
jgi:raffinose/stachyose/melibiose transport system permease protein